MTTRSGGAITRDQFRRDVAGWSQKIGVTPKRVQIQILRKKWASCSPAGRLTFSSDLLRASPSFRTEVIVHELLHLTVANHGKLFRSLLKAHLGLRGSNVETSGCTKSRD